MKLDVKDVKGEVVGSIDADDSVWGVKPNHALLHQAVVAQRANKRQGTQDTQTRAEVSRSTRKLRTQKHTGRARLGSAKSPNLRGGGVAHGPHPRSHSKRLPKKMRRQALRIALSDHVRGESITVLDGIAVDSPKTRVLADMMTALEVRGTALIVVANSSDGLLRSCANLGAVTVLEAQNLNSLQTVTARNLLLTQDAIKVIDGLWGEGKAGG